jgi:hypothetical protein
MLTGLISIQLEELGFKKKTLNEIIILISTNFGSWSMQNIEGWNYY